MKTHDKKWAIQQMLDKLRVQNVNYVRSLNLGYSEKDIQSHYFKFNGDNFTLNISMHGLYLDFNKKQSKFGWTLCEEPKKVELPKVIENINDYSRNYNHNSTSLYHLTLKSIGELSAQVNQIIKYLKAKEEDNEQNKQ